MTVGTPDPDRPGLGARLDPRGVSVTVWAPAARAVDVVLLGRPNQRFRLRPEARGYHHGTVPADVGDHYALSLDGGPALADPASRHQPDGVFGPSAIIDPTSWSWTDGDWPGLDLDGLIVYECHVGTLSMGGTLDTAIPELDRLVELGITAVELMPVAQFPGTRNWGYDVAFPWAVQSSYGGPAALARFVDAAHRRGIGVILDVVFNHLGPEGAVLHHFGPYLTDRYRTPWGSAINFDGPGSDEVRRYFIDSAVAFAVDHHVDGFRLDALHAIVDSSAVTFVEELTAAVRAAAERTGRPCLMIGESSANDPRLVTPVAEGGIGLDAVWDDDVHHALRTALTGESHDYYRDYQGVPDLARALRHRWVYDGRFSPQRDRRHGRPAEHLPYQSFVAFSANHDHIGNRARGDRLDSLVGFERRKVAPATVLLSPFTPLLFMGEEYGERRPFPYFVDHLDPDLLDAVRRGRRAEFADQIGEAEVLDPADEHTYRAAVLDPSERFMGRGATLWRLYRHLIDLRSRLTVLTDPGAEMTVTGDGDDNGGTVAVHRRSGPDASLLILAFDPGPTAVAVPGDGIWRLLLDTAAPEWEGPGSDLPEEIRGGGELVVTGPGAVLLASGPNARTAA